jgi:dienelactone hydrolase
MVCAMPPVLLTVLVSACGGGGSQPEPPKALEDVTISAGAIDVAAFYREPDGAGPSPAVLYDHGAIVESLGADGAAAQGYDVRDFVDAIALAGFVGLAPVRPEASFEDLRSIIRASIAWLGEKPAVDPDRIFVIGFSKGGLLSLQVAVEDDSALGGLVLMSAAAGAQSPDGWSDWATTENLSALDVPVLATAGALEADTEIGVGMQTFVDDMTALGKDVESHLDYAGADHHWFYEVRDEYWPDVVGWLDRHAGGTP